MAKSNLAYDLSRYEETLEREQQKKGGGRAQQIRVRRMVERSATAAVPKSMALILLVGLLMAVMLYGKAEASTLQNQITDQAKSNTMLYSENVRMQTEIEGKSSQKNVEEYAESVLGLQKLDQAQVEYVQLETDNVVEIPEDNQSIFVKIQHQFEKIIAYLMG